MALRTSRPHIGPRLRQARADLGVNLAQAAEETGIDVSCLEALEHDLPPDDLHGGVYARIFLREYARYLGLNPKPLVGAYRIAHPERDRPLLGGPPPVEPGPARWVKRGLVALSVGALAAMVIMTVPRPSDPGALTPGDIGPAPASPAAEPQPPSVPDLPEGLHLEVRVLDAASWIQVVRGDEILFERTLDPGAVRRFRAQRSLQLVVGNAGAVRLSVNGDRLPVLGNAGEVFDGSVVLRDGKAELVRAN